MPRLYFLPRLRTAIRLSLMLACAGVVVSAAPPVAEAGIFKKAKKKLKKSGKKVNKASNKSIDKARKKLKKAGKSVNQANGAISGMVKHAYDYADKETNAALRFAEKQLKKAEKSLKKLAQAAMKTLFKNAFVKALKRYTVLIGMMAKALPKIMDRVEVITLHLINGNYEKATKLAKELRNAKVMKPILAKAHKLMGTSFVVQVDVEVSANIPGSGLTPSGELSGAIGVAMNLDPTEEESAVVFVTGGGAVGGTITIPDDVGGVDIGASIGFSAGKPSNVGGVDITVGGAMGTPGWTGAVEFGFPVKWADIKPNSFMMGARLAVPFSDKPGLSGDVMIGGSYTHIITKVKK